MRCARAGVAGGWARAGVSGGGRQVVGVSWGFFFWWFSRDRYWKVREGEVGLGVGVFSVWLFRVVENKEVGGRVVL